jgi:hypothetical protein
VIISNFTGRMKRRKKREKKKRIEEGEKKEVRDFLSLYS